MAPERNGIISAGTWALDRIKLVDAWPQEEHLAQIVGTDKQGGGSGYNLAIDMTRLNDTIPVYAIGLVGKDSDGEFLVAQAQASGIVTDQLHRTEEEPTSYTDVISDITTGKRTFFHYRGTSDLLSPNHFDFQNCRGRILHLGLVGLHETMDAAWDGNDNGWVAVLAAAKAEGIHTNLELVSIDSAKIRALASPCLPHLDSLIINEYELGALSGLPVTDRNGQVSQTLCVAAMQSLLSISSLAFIVVHYPEAAIAVTTEGETIVKGSFNVHPDWIKSAVGAGDAFASGMLLGVHEEMTLEDSLELAHAVAAASLRATSTVASVESVADCLAFAQQAHKSPNHS